MKAKKNTVTIDYGGGLVIEIDPAAAWEEFASDTFEGQLESVASPHFWCVHLPGLDLAESEKKTFWEAFNRPGAERERLVAIRGLTVANYGELFDFLAQAIDFTKCRDAGDYEKNPEAGKRRLLTIGAQFAAIAARKDHREFRRMMEMIKAGGIPQSGLASATGCYSEAGIAIRAFCEFVAENKNLPTKKKFRELARVPKDDKAAAEVFRKTLKNMGFDGLPKAKKGA